MKSSASPLPRGPQNPVKHEWRLATAPAVTKGVSTTPRARRATQRGVTLIELLIAVTLVALLSTGMLMALRLGLTSMEKTTDRLYDNRRVMSVNHIIDAEIAGIVVNKTRCLGGGQPTDEVSFFQGEPQTMRFVSTFSLDDAARGYPKILEFQVIPGEKEGVRLIVNESIYAGPLSTGRFCVGLQPNPAAGNQPTPVFLPVQAGSQSFVLADKLAYCRLSYRESLPAAPYEQWWPVWGKELMPTAIRIDMAPLPSEKMRLPLTTITAPVHVTRDAKMNYDSN